MGGYRSVGGGEVESEIWEGTGGWVGGLRVRYGSVQVAGARGDGLRKYAFILERGAVANSWE